MSICLLDLISTSYKKHVLLMKVVSYLDILSQLRLCTNEPLGTSVLQRIYQMKDNGHISLKVKKLNLVCQKLMSMTRK